MARIHDIKSMAMGVLFIIGMSAAIAAVVVFALAGNSQ